MGEQRLTEMLCEFPFEGDLGELPLEIHKRQLRAHYEQYLTYGGYPAVVLETDHERKLYLLREIYESYVRKDINQILLNKSRLTGSHGSGSETR